MTLRRSMRVLLVVLAVAALSGCSVAQRRDWGLGLTLLGGAGTVASGAGYATSGTECVRELTPEPYCRPSADPTFNRRLATVGLVASAAALVTGLVLLFSASGK